MGIATLERPFVGLLSGPLFSKNLLRGYLISISASYFRFKSDYKFQFRHFFTLTT
jgi:hypothetical protein